MMNHRRRWGFLLFLALGVIWICQMLPQPAEATGEKAPTYFSGIETMVFRNLESPTPDYDGIRFYGCRADSTSSTMGDMKGPADSLVWAGDALENTYLHRVVLRADLSALPDSAIILEATLYALVLGRNSATTEVPQLATYRLFRPFDSGVCWTYRKTETTVDTAWSAAGILAAYASGPTWAAYGASTYQVLAPTNEYRTLGTGLPQIAGYALAMGSDSLYSGYSQVTTTGSPREALSAPDAVFPGRWIFQSSNAWARFDVTSYVRHWHSGQWANHGLVISMNRSDETTGYYVKFRGCFPETTVTGAISRRQPFLIVKYIHCVSP